MKRTEVMFFFDTEDFTCDASQTAAMQLADILTEEGVTGHFAVVGLVAKRLVDTGRTDVIESLKRHEIGSHTWGHTVHPDICELTDCEDFSLAYSRVREQEGEAIEIIKSAFGLSEILFAVPPGNSKSYAAMYYYADAGLPFYCDTVVADENGTDTHCVNAMHIAYNTAVEEVAFRGNVKDALDDLAGRSRVIIFTHPNMAYFSDFWDKVNFRKANLCPDGEYMPCPERTEEETERYFDTFRAIVRAVKADERFRVTTLREILAAQTPPAPVHPGDVPALHAALLRDFAPVWEKKLRLYDLFMAAADFLAGKTEYIPGKAYGLLSASREIAESVTLSVQAVREAATKVDRDAFLPGEFIVDGHRIGTGDMLYAMYAALTAPGDSFELSPHPEMIFLSRYPELVRFALRGTWMHGDDLEDNYLSDRLRLQAWTIR